MMKDSKKWSEALAYNKKSVFQRREDADIDKAMAFARDYAAFLDAAKTEREAVRESIRLAEAKGFRPYRLGDKVKAGDPVATLYTNRKESLKEAERMVASAIEIASNPPQKLPLIYKTVG